MNATFEQVSPEVAQALVSQAVAQGLSVNDYLRGMLGLSDATNGNLALKEDQSPRNETMFAALQQSAERLKDQPVSGSTEQTLQIIREGRMGAIYGYEPTDTD